MYKLIFTILLVLGFAGTASATTWTAANCEATTVNALVDHVNTVDGDTVVIPAGTCTWAINGVTVSGKGIKIVGAAGLTLINNTTPGGDGGALVITEDTTHSTEVSNLVIREASGNGGGNAFFLRVFYGGVTGKPVLIHDNVCTGVNCTRLVRFHVNRGVVYKNNWTSTVWRNGVQFCGKEICPDYVNRQFVSCRGSGHSGYDANAGHDPWNGAPRYGTADNTGKSLLYIENNYIDSVTETIDIDSGCRAVIRFNRFLAAGVGGHGYDSGGIGCRHREVYNNVFLLKIVGSETNTGRSAGWVTFRGCSGIVADNVLQAITYQSNYTVSGIVQALGEYNANAGNRISCWGSEANPEHGRPGFSQYTVNANNTYAGNPGSHYPAPNQPGWGRNSTGTADAMEGIYIYSNEDEIDDALLWTGDPGPITSVQSWNQADDTFLYRAPNPTAEPRGCKFVHSAFDTSTMDSTAAYLGPVVFMGTAKPGYTKCVGQPSLGCNYPHPCRHDVQGTACGLSGTPPDNPPSVSLATPTSGVTYDTTATTVSISGTATDDGSISTGTWANSLTGGSGNVTGTTNWSVSNIPLSLGLNPITVTMVDNSANNTQITLTVFRDDCGSSLPYTNTFGLFGDGTTWPTTGPCFTQYGIGSRHTIASNKLTSASATCEAFTGQVLPANQSISGLVAAISGTSGTRFMVRMSGSPGQADNFYGLFLQVAPTNTFIGRYNGVFGFDNIYENYTADIGTPVSDVTTARVEIAGNLMRGFVDIDGAGAGAEVELTPPVDVSQVVVNGAYPIANGPVGLCFSTSGRGVDNLTIDEVSPTPSDTTPPTIDAVNSPAEGSVTEDVEIAIGGLSIEVSDDTGPFRCEFENNRAPGIVAMNLSSGTCTNTAAIPLFVGSNNFTLRVFDAADNVSTPTSVTVIRNQPDVTPTTRPRRRLR